MRTSMIPVVVGALGLSNAPIVSERIPDSLCLKEILIEID